MTKDCTILKYIHIFKLKYSYVIVSHFSFFISFLLDDNLKLFQYLLAAFEGKSVPDILVTLMSRDKTTEMQLAAAKW